MKGIKYIISFCILLVGMLIIGEGHILHLDNFYTEFSTTTLFLQDNTTEKEMINDILNSSVHNEVEVFTFVKTPRSSFFAGYDIYGTSGVEKYINENLNIFEKEYSSLFMGDIGFTFNDLKNISGLEDIHNFYVIGSKEKVHQFKMDLINKYAGNHPKDGYVNNDLRNTIIAIWLLIISIILLFSFYDTILQKKENLIRISMGERIGKIILKNILLDSFILILSFGIVIFVLHKYTYVFFRFDISLFLFSILIFANGIVYLNLYFYNLKEVFSNVKGSKKLLSLNYSLKLITAIITIFIISSNVVIIFESYNLYKQKSFFEDHADYSYIELLYRDSYNDDGSSISRFDESMKVMTDFYKEFFEKSNATSLVSARGSFGEKESVYTNKNTFEYLSSKIKELKDLTLNKDVYLLIPKNMSNDPEIMDKFKMVMKFLRWDNFNYDVVYYEENVNLISIDKNYIYGSKFVENPIIIHNNMTVDEMLSNQQESSLPKTNIAYLNETMYNISDDDFNQFIEEHDLIGHITKKTNVLENYEHHWISAKRLLYMNGIFSILVLLLEFIIISSIIKMEYEVNAIELAIKKVMGYSTLNKNSKIILMTVIVTILSILSAITIALILEIDNVYYLAVGGIVIMILELITITFYINKIENSKISKILKGGNL